MFPWKMVSLPTLLIEIVFVGVSWPHYMYNPLNMYDFVPTFCGHNQQVVSFSSRYLESACCLGWHQDDFGKRCIAYECPRDILIYDRRATVVTWHIFIKRVWAIFLLLFFFTNNTLINIDLSVFPVSWAFVISRDSRVLENKNVWIIYMLLNIYNEVRNQSITVCSRYTAEKRWDGRKV